MKERTGWRGLVEWIWKMNGVFWELWALGGWSVSSVGALDDGLNCSDPVRNSVFLVQRLENECKRYIIKCKYCSITIFVSSLSLKSFPGLKRLVKTSRFYGEIPWSTPEK
jgi:hypothetical protein